MIEILEKEIIDNDDFSSIRSTLEKQTHLIKTSRPIAVFTDFGNTLFKQEVNNEDKYQSATNEFIKACGEYCIPVVVVTGNDLPIMQRHIKDSHIPQLPIQISSVGTEIYILQSDETYKLCEEYDQKMMALFDRQKIYPALSKFEENARNRGIKLSF